MMKPTHLGWLVIALALAWGPEASRGEELTIAAASDLNFAFKELVAQFERESGHQVKLSLGSSGNLFSQIQNGAPFDLYFSADIRYPRKLIESGHADPDSLYAYAVGRLVVWVPRGSAIRVKERGMDSLLDSSVRKIAIANPKHAPYGRAAVAAFEHFKLYEQVKDKLVLGENISQAAQFVESGAADIGLIALSLALAPAMMEKGQYWEVPVGAHPALEQGAVMVRATHHRRAATEFLAFLKGQRGRAVMKRLGFVVPGESTTP